MPLGLEITGPQAVAPGSTAQFKAITPMSDGTTRDVTNETQWRSNSFSLTVTAPGVVSAGTNTGEAMLSAAYSGLMSTREVILVPEGTFRFIGTVTDTMAPGGPIEAVRVQVISGTGQGLQFQTDHDGTFRLYGVAGMLELRFSKLGYETRNEHFQVTDHERRNVDLRRLFDVPDVSGTYTMTIAAADTCGTSLPAEAMSRKYSAVLTQVGWTLTVKAGGATFAKINGWFPADTIRDGTVDTQRVRLVFGTLGCGGYYYGCGPSILEQVSTTRFFLPSGQATLEISPTRLAGELDGTIEVHDGPETPNLVRVASCRSTRHTITFSR
jgi:hypothetical protein